MNNFTPEEKAEICAQISFHELLFEIIFASNFAYSRNPLPDWENFKRDLLDKVYFKGYTPGKIMDSETVFEIQRQAEMIANNFLDKTELRLKGILDDKADTSETAQ